MELPTTGGIGSVHLSKGLSIRQVNEKIRIHKNKKNKNCFQKDVKQQSAST